MRKNRSILLLVILLVISAAVFFATSATTQKNPESGKQTQGTNIRSLVEVSVENGQTVLTEKNVNASTAFDALVAIANKQHLEVKTKKYDFGIFVEQIGLLPNTKEKAWIYFLNGKSGTAAADKQTVKTGDVVEWKYITPSFE
jgi:hypothetical protein